MKTKHKFAVVEDGKETVCCGCCYCSKTTRRTAICVFTTLALVVIALIASILIRTATSESPYEDLKPLDSSPNFINSTLDEKEARARRLGRAISFPTISYNKSYTNPTALKDLQDYLLDTFSEVLNAPFVQYHVVHDYSLLLRIEGKTLTQNPFLLCGHLDVVPEGDLDSWSRPPFSGELFIDEDDGQQYIFGRGAIDDKQSVMAILEAIKAMVLDGDQPNRTFYVAFGHDEEVGGDNGAGNLASRLKAMLEQHQEKLSFILDEGMFVMHDVFPGVSDPVAYIGVVEKGWAEVNLTVHGTQGHSSTPPKESSIGILAKAISNIEDNPQPSMFGSGVEYDTMEYVAPYASFGYKMILSNLWLFKPIVSMILSNDKATDAIQRSTTAVTIIRGGVKNNVVPPVASALINHRIHPSDSASAVVDHDIHAINDDRVQVTLTDNFAPTSVSSYQSDFAPFATIANSIRDVFPNAIITPGTMVANTDTKHYLSLCDAIYRFQPVRLGKSDISRFHGIDERISVENFDQVVEFYYRLINNANFGVQEKLANNDQIFNDLPVYDYDEYTADNSTILE